MGGGGGVMVRDSDETSGKLCERELEIEREREKRAREREEIDR